MTREEADFIGAMNMCDEISNEAYKKIMCHCEEQQPCEDCVSRTDVLKLMCEKCPVYDCITGCQSYRSIEKMPSVTLKAESGEVSVLDKIRAEIEKLKNAPPCFDDMFEYKYAVDDVLAIIDKYKTESEDEE